MNAERKFRRWINPEHARPGRSECIHDESVQCIDGLHSYYPGGVARPPVKANRRRTHRRKP